MKQSYFIFLISFIFTFSAFSNDGFYNVNDYGIQADSTVLVTHNINGLIKTINEKGGGTIYFPSGTYLTGSIHLLSNVTIYLEAGARLKFSDNFEHYLPMVKSRYEGVDVYSFSPLIYAWEAKNIAIIGRGTIDGQGKKWWDHHLKYFKAPIDSTLKWQIEYKQKNKDMLMPDDPYLFERGFLRPPFIQPMHCENVKIEGITIINSPFWTVNPEYCENVTITGVTIINPESPNTDGINPESCKNVHISDCHISVGDDCITIKSGRDLPGRIMAAPAENYTITNCTMLSGHGGVVIGSEMSGGVRNIVISNCIFDGTDRGIRIKSTRGRGGIVEDIRVSNIVMRNIRMEAVKLNLLYSKTKPEPISERTPQFKNIHISNITGDAKQAIALIGLPEMPLNNITFSNINLVSEIGVTVTDAENIRFNLVSIENQSYPSFSVENAENIEFNGCTSSGEVENLSVIYLNNVKTALIHNCFQVASKKIFIEVAGEESKDIYIRNNWIQNVEKMIKKSYEVNKETIFFD